MKIKLHFDLGLLRFIAHSDSSSVVIRGLCSRPLDPPGYNIGYIIFYSRRNKNDTTGNGREQRIKQPPANHCTNVFITETHKSKYLLRKFEGLLKAFRSKFASMQRRVRPRKLRRKQQNLQKPSPLRKQESCTYNFDHLQFYVLTPSCVLRCAVSFSLIFLIII